MGPHALHLLFRPPSLPFKALGLRDLLFELVVEFPLQTLGLCDLLF